jgi:thymidylate synthase ThyX
MKVTLAGATLDRRFWKDDPAATPETVSAAYARISHSPKRLKDLRDEAVAQVDKARRSNESIVYKMGHSSIAEHAVFNVDIEDCSRLLVEFIEGHRLASYTERSQRYVFFGDKVPVVPSEFEGTPFGSRLAELDRRRFDLYKDLTSDEDLSARYGDKLLEEARYILGVTCPTDIGMTVNAREAEHMIASGSSHALSEVREFSEMLLSATGGLAPSLIKYARGSGFKDMARSEVLSVIEEYVTHGKGGDAMRCGCGSAVCSEIPCHGEDPESEIAAALIFEATDMDMSECRSIARDLTDDELKRLFKPLFEHYPVHSSLPRAFEMMDLVFDFEISASGFAQLKRHRMATIITQGYSPLKWDTPSIMREDPNATARYIELMKQGQDLYREVKVALGEGPAQYCLCNANRRRVVLKMNLRELYHFVRLRSDEHAQTEIRRISDSLIWVMKERYPVVTALLCGKDRYDRIRSELLSCKDL